MEPVDIVVESLLKSASTEAVKRGIDAISTKLRTVFDKGNPEEIKKVIQEENLTTSVAALAKENLDTSYIVPFSSLHEARPQHKVNLFLHIINLGFNLSKENNMDILLPGSLLGVKNISMFTTFKSPPIVASEKLNIRLSNEMNHGFFCIFPLGSTSEEFLEQYKAKVKKIRNESEGYIQCGPVMGENTWKYSVSRISAGSVEFKYGSLFKPHQKENLDRMEDNTCEIGDWSSGIISMLKYAQIYSTISILNEEEGLNLLKLADELKNFYQK